MKGSMKMPVKAKPYRHQQEAFDFVCRLFGLTDGQQRSSGAALLMEMGTGKTLVAIAVACILYQFGLAERVLVVAPLSLLGVWESELQRFAGVPVNAVVLKGTLDKKAGIDFSQAQFSMERMLTGEERQVIEQMTEMVKGYAMNLGTAALVTDEDNPFTNVDPETGEIVEPLT